MVVPRLTSLAFWGGLSRQLHYTLGTSSRAAQTAVAACSAAVSRCQRHSFWRHQVDAARTLLGLGAAVNAADHRGRTALHLAAFADRRRVARLRRTHGPCNPMTDRQTDCSRHVPGADKPGRHTAARLYMCVRGYSPVHSKLHSICVWSQAAR